MEITVDTHVLIWWMDETLNKKLSKKTLKIMADAEQTGTIYIPMIVLMETLYLIERGKGNLSFNHILANIEKNNHYKIIPFDTPLLKIAETVKGLEAHDRIVVSTALLTNSPLISKDKEIGGIKGIKVIW
ncbi:MAG: PIN domain-containing protein [Nitrospirae bacterium]|nr:PIN domain-containing protein [Nitrospirota bacterium]